MVKLENVSFKYSDKDVILKDASIDFSRNKTTILLGKNGVGKTTLLSLIDGFLVNDGGVIKKDSESVYIYDNPQLYEYITGEEYIDLIKSIGNQKNKKDIMPLVKSLELGESLNKIISSYSLGMKHKLALLTAIMLDYELYLIDEPLAALDPDSQKFMINFFKNMKINNKTLIISTHMINVAYEMADEIIIFKNHKLKKFKNNFSTYEEFNEFVVKLIREDE